MSSTQARNVGVFAGLVLFLIGSVSLAVAILDQLDILFRHGSGGIPVGLFWLIAAVCIAAGLLLRRLRPGSGRSGQRR